MHHKCACITYVNFSVLLCLCEECSVFAVRHPSCWLTKACTWHHTVLWIAVRVHFAHVCQIYDCLRTGECVLCVYCFIFVVAVGGVVALCCFSSFSAIVNRMHVADIVSFYHVQSGGAKCESKRSYQWRWGRVHRITRVLTETVFVLSITLLLFGKRLKPYTTHLCSIYCERLMKCDFMRRAISDAHGIWLCRVATAYANIDNKLNIQTQSHAYAF